MSTERLILETKLVKELNGVIKKLNDEVDILKQKGNKDEKSDVRSAREKV